MSFTYDSTVEDAWADLSQMRRNSPALRFDYALARLIKENKNGTLSDEKKRSLVCKIIDQKELQVDKTQWKFESLRTSCVATNSYLCLCSLPTNKYFIVSNDSGVKVRVGPECLEKLLCGKELENATRAMQLEITRNNERKRAIQSSRK